MAGAVITLTLFSGQAGAADEVIDPTGSGPSAFGGVVAWNHQVSDEASTLRVLQNGTTVDVRSSAGSFSPNVGPGPDGKPVVVYSWCTHPERSEKRFQGCDLYLYDAGQGRTRKLRAISTAKRVESQPAIWRNRVVFYGDRERRVDSLKLYVGDLRNGSVRRLRVGPIKVFEKGDEPTPLGAAIKGDEILTAWQITPEAFCQDAVDPNPQPVVPTPVLAPGEYGYDHDGPGDPTDHGRWEVWSTKLRTHPSHRRLVRSCDLIGTPLFDGPTASWPRDSYPDSLESSAARTPFASGANASTGIAVDGGMFYFNRLPQLRSATPAPLIRVPNAAEL